MRYCKKCVLPDTRPGLEIGNDGICTACKGHEQKDINIDWDKRRKELESLIADAKKRSSGYDCIIPVSGGKDSTWQVIKCLEYNLRILAVTWKTPARTELGQKNLDNLVKLGVDHIDYTIDPEVEKRFMYKTLVKTGSTAVPMHMALYAIPLKIAVNYNIPLVVWGESPHMEYGGTEENRNRNQLDMEWFKRHGILQDTCAEDWLDEDLTRKDLGPYFLPDETEFKEKKVKSIFLGYYIKWDPEESLRVAKENGFQVRKEGPKVGYYNYADIDCDFISIHHHFKLLKFGFTRLFDNLSIEIRNNRMTRADAVRVIYEQGDQRPDEDIDNLCRFIDISSDHFRGIEEKFRNQDIWKKDKNGEWRLPDFEREFGFRLKRNGG